MEQITPQAFVLAAEAIGSGVAMLSMFGPAIGEGIVGSKAVEAIGRQPEAAGVVTRTMIIADAIAETTGIYAFVFALLVMFTKPFSSALS
ncbi:MAG: ATP synthase F0 subunit C [Oscillospiraceae bacterium]|nr:ATP synthase F0 subunit C [Oscillospiraceae bacterium]